MLSENNSNVHGHEGYFQVSYATQKNHAANFTKDDILLAKTEEDFLYHICEHNHSLENNNSSVSTKGKNRNYSLYEELFFLKKKKKHYLPIIMLTTSFIFAPFPTCPK